VGHAAGRPYKAAGSELNDIAITVSRPGVLSLRADPTARARAFPRIFTLFDVLRPGTPTPSRLDLQLEESFGGLRTEAGTSNVNYTFTNRVPVSLTQ